MRILILEAKFVRKNCALFTGQYGKSYFEVVTDFLSTRMIRGKIKTFGEHLYF